MSVTPSGKESVHLTYVAKKEGCAEARASQPLLTSQIEDEGCVYKRRIHQMHTHNRGSHVAGVQRTQSYRRVTFG